MAKRDFSLKETLQYANEANKYARQQIKKGSTQLENNDLEKAYYEYLYEGVKSVRSTTEAKMTPNPLKSPTLVRYEKNHPSYVKIFSW